MTQNVYRFRLNGMDYQLRGDKTTEEMEEIVAAVDEKLQSIREAAPGYSGLRATTLAAIQLSEELLEARREISALLAEVNLGGQEYELFQQAQAKATKRKRKTRAGEADSAVSP